MPSANVVRPLAEIQRLRWLTRVNDVAVGASLAAFWCAVMAPVLQQGRVLDWITVEPSVSLGLSTLLVGTLWNRWMRGKGWRGLLKTSLVLAPLNAALACFLTYGPLGALAGVTLGAMFWLPAMALTMLLFGGPLAWSWRLAERGVAGEERGEMVVGGSAVLLSLVGLGFLLWPWLPSGWWCSRVAAMLRLALSLLGGVAGAVAAAAAFTRQRRRRELVGLVEQGGLPGYRVEARPEGRVLLRIDAVGGQAYRVANFEHELARFDEAGDLLELTEPSEDLAALARAQPPQSEPPSSRR